MSAAAMAWAFESVAADECDLTVADKLVLFRLADRADPRGVCWPGHERTARDLGISESTVRKAIGDLVRARLLDVVRRRDSDGRDKPNLYQLHVTRAGVPNSGARPTKCVGVVPKSAPEPQNKSNIQEKQKQSEPPPMAAAVVQSDSANAAASHTRSKPASKKPGSPLDVIDGVLVYRSTDDLERLSACRSQVSTDTFLQIVANLPEPRYVSQVETRVRDYLAAESAREADRRRRATEAKERADANLRRNSPAAIAAREATLEQLAKLFRTSSS